LTDVAIQESSFAEYINMFLKLKQESYGYPSWVQSEADKDKYIEDYRCAEGIALDKASISKNAGQFSLAKQIKLDVRKIGSKPKQYPDNYCDLSESVIRASDKSGY
jgi:hypothetical protein